MIAYPKYWRIKVTNRCNLSCTFCHQENMPANRRLYQYIDVVFIRKLASGLIESNDIVALTGGEPLLHKEFNQIASIICDKVKTKCHLNTNGTLLDRKLKYLKLLPLSNIHINLCTLNPKTYNSIYGKNCLNNIHSTIIKAIELGFNITINYVVIAGINDAIHNMKNIIKFALYNKCNLSIIESLFDYCSESKGYNFQKTYKDILISLGFNKYNERAGRCFYSKRGFKSSIIVAAPCSPAAAWNGTIKDDALLVTEDQTIKRFFTGNYYEK
ncbi:MAG: radical SAM protein [candidate division Zixibacteria bacterium]|nr:radical SAM protein [candidate division Zixibacteria bacterium]